MATLAAPPAPAVAVGVAATKPAAAAEAAAAAKAAAAAAEATAAATEAAAEAAATAAAAPAYKHLSRDERRYLERHGEALLRRLILLKEKNGVLADAAGIGDRDDIEAAATSAAAECPGASAPPQKLVDDNTPHAAKAREMQSGGWSR